MSIRVLARPTRATWKVGVGTWVTLLSGVACTGTVGEVSEPGDQATGNRGGSSRDDDDATAGAGQAGAGEPPSAAIALTCTSPGINPGRSPLRRLTNTQFANSLRDLFTGIMAVPAVELPGETLVNGYDNNVDGQTASPALLESYRNIAKKTAETATTATTLAKIAPCATGADQNVCAQQFVTTWARKIFRRPATSAESNRLLALFKSSLIDGYAAAVSDTLQALLSSPQFLYRIEVGGTGADGAIALDHHQVAVRLSYLLWDTIPDAELAAAADQGALTSADGVARQVDRMLIDARAKPVIAAFQRQWLMLDGLQSLSKNTEAFPNWNDTAARSLRDSVTKYVEHMFWNQGDLGALLTDSRAYVDQASGWIWGVGDAPATAELMDVGATRRSGILTQAGLMAALAKPSNDSPVFRGLFVMRQLLCSDTGEPPPNISTTIAEPAAGEAPKTTRQRQEQSHAAPACASCHSAIDGIGFAFGHYDAVGAWRDEENGIAIDASGELLGTRDADGTFDGAVELGDRLANSLQVKQCVATQMFRWSFGRNETEDDGCALLPIVNQFVESNGDFKILLKTIATSDAFRYRQGV